MSHSVAAIYENGTLKLEQPLPLAYHQKVRVTIESMASAEDALAAVERTYGIVGWTGDAEDLERIALDPEFDIAESP